MRFFISSAPQCITLIRTYQLPPATSLFKWFSRPGSTTQTGVRNSWQPRQSHCVVRHRVFPNVTYCGSVFRNTYIGTAGDPCFVTLPLTEDGPLVLLAEHDFLKGFLKERGLTLLWAVRSEKYHFERFLGSNYLGYTEYTRAHLFANDKIKNSDPLIERLRPVHY